MGIIRLGRMVAGTGHFVKMYTMEVSIMQAYAEVFHIPKNARSEALPEAERFNLDIAAIAEVWRRGSIITSQLLDLAARALANDPSLDAYSGLVEDRAGGERC